MKVIRMTDDRMSSEGNDFVRQSAGNGSNADNRTVPGAFRGGLSGVERQGGMPTARVGRVTGQGSHARPAAASKTNGISAPGAGVGSREAVRAASGEGARAQALEERRKAVPDEDEEYEEERFPTWARVAFWLFRKSIVPVIMVVMLLAGLYVGYVYLGKAPKEDVFEWATWRHLYDLIFAES